MPFLWMLLGVGALILLGGGGSQTPAPSTGPTPPPPPGPPKPPSPPTPVPPGPPSPPLPTGPTQKWRPLGRFDLFEKGKTYRLGFSSSFSLMPQQWTITALLSALDLVGSAGPTNIGGYKIWTASDPLPSDWPKDDIDGSYKSRIQFMYTNDVPIPVGSIMGSVIPFDANAYVLA